jgi:hypothetical protein
MRTSSRVILSAVLLVVLSVGAVHAAPWSLTREEAPSLLSALWDTLVSQVTALGEKGRGELDPNGVTVPEPIPVSGDGDAEGRGELDPNGAPTP